jgi:hypothetical protein
MHFVYALFIIFGGASSFAANEVPLPPFALISNFRDKVEEANQFKDINFDNFTGTRERITELSGATSWIYPDLTSWDLDLGIFTNKSAQIRHISRLPSAILYDVVYTVDPFGRRYLWEPQKVTAKRFAVVTGCSFTFGAGLPDDATVTHYLARKLQLYHPYNYAMPGGGANTALALVQSGRLRKEIPEANGIFIYVSLSDVDRTSGKLPSLKWLQHTPFYKLKKNILERHGSFLSGRRFMTKLFLTWSKIASFLHIPSGKIMPPMTKKDFEHHCRIVRQMQDDFLRQYPKSRFLVYGHPLKPTPKILSDCYHRLKVNFYEGRFIGDDKAMFIETDNHPSAAANKVIAGELRKIIEPFEKTNEAL